MSGAVVAIAEAMGPCIAHAGLWGCYAILAAAKALAAAAAVKTDRSPVARRGFFRPAKAGR